MISTLFDFGRQAFMSLSTVATLYVLLAWCVGAIVSTLVFRRWQPALHRRESRSLSFLLEDSRFRFLLLVEIWLVAQELLFHLVGITSPLLELPGRLVGAWLLINVLCAPIRQRAVAWVIATTTWFVAALDILDLLQLSIDFLERQTFWIGAVEISLFALVKSLITLAALFWIVVGILRLLESRLNSNKDIHPSAKILVSKVVRVALLAAATICGLSIAGVDPALLAVFSGTIAVGAAFGLQNVISNLFCGMLLLMDRTIKPGDVIGLNDGKIYGIVDKLNARCVSVKSREGIEYLIPNEQFITSRVENWSYSNKLIRVKLDLRVAADADLDRVEAILYDILGSLARVKRDPAPGVRFRGMLENWVDLQVRFWISDPENGSSGIRSEFVKRAIRRFREEGIVVPLKVLELHQN